MSALPVAVMVIVGLVPSPAVIGAVQTLSSVLSDALTLVALVYVLPAESLTPEIVAAGLLHTPAITTSRFPTVVADAGVSWRVEPVMRPDTRCTKRGAALGVTAPDCGRLRPVADRVGGAHRERVRHAVASGPAPRRSSAPASRSRWWAAAPPRPGTASRCTC